MFSYPLVLTRLCFSVCIAARQTRDAPDNDYLNISNAPVWALLEKLHATLAIGPPGSSLCLRLAAGRELVANLRGRCDANRVT